MICAVFVDPSNLERMVRRHVLIVAHHRAGFSPANARRGAPRRATTGGVWSGSQGDWRARRSSIRSGARHRDCSTLVAMPGKSHGHGWTKKFSAVRSDYFVTVVDFAPAAEADGAFRFWLVEHRLDRDDIAPGDLVIDSGRSEVGIVRRYRVHRDAIPD